jgi:phenylalanyl-tRNA synthetase alpha chain
MLIRITKLVKGATDQISQALNEKDLEGVRLEYLGEDGKLSVILSEVKNLNKSDRREVGYAINSAKRTIEKELKDKLDEFSEEICESP